MGHELAVSCHNCYTLANETVNATQVLAYIHDGQGAGADLIEIDLVAHDGDWLVSHGQPSGPQMADIFSDYAFRTGTQIPFIEIKSNISDSTLADKLVNTLHQLQYLVPGKMVVIRSFYSI
jgi:hypothetical protein